MNTKLNIQALFLAIAVVILMLQPAEAVAQCRLCSSDTSKSSSTAENSRAEKPLRIEITANLDFSRLALTSRSGGEISIDPVSGQRQISGALTNLGGLSLQGEGRLEGEPGRLVRVTLPERIILTAPNGATAELVKLDTNLPAQARLDNAGRLTFSFGGKLRVTGDASGRFRGRIAITAEYE